MNIKKKKLILASVFAGMITAISTAVAIPKITEKPIMATAATTPKYSIAFCYDYKYTYGSAGGTTTTTTTETDVYSASLQYGNSMYCTVSVSIYGSESSGTGALPNGGLIKSNTVNIEITSSFSSPSIAVKNASGTTVGSQSGKSITLTGLTDGKYDVSINFGNSAWMVNARAGASASVTGTCSFMIDNTAPTITGASASTTGKYTNQSFTVSASDSGSGVENLYMKSPSASSYSAVGTSKTVAAGSTNGLYRFYAVDNAGNSSATYYVYYDNAAPTGKIIDTAGNELTSGYTNRAFSYTATDSGSGINKLQYKTPSSEIWLIYTSGKVIGADSEPGTYLFRAADNALNFSGSMQIVLDTENPTGKLYAGSSEVESGSKVKANYIKFVASDSLSGIKKIYVKEPGATEFSLYTNNSQYAVNGQYTFYCEDNAGNISSTYTITLDNTPPVLICNGTDFYSTTGQGFTVLASDALGSCRLYHKSPGENVYVQTTDFFTVSQKDKDGKYYFYAEDDSGNVSSVYWVELSVEVPRAQIVRDSGSNKVCVTWTDSDCTATLNGYSYSKGTWITEEGDYTLNLISGITYRTGTYTFSVTHYYEAGEIISPTCTEQGYTIYNCISCEDSYLSDYISALGHRYEEERVQTDCVNGGYVRHICTVCGDEYITDETAAFGHRYTEITVEPSCTEEGGLKHICVVCGYSYLTEVEAPTGHCYISEILITATCTENGERRFSCEKCGDEYTSVIPAFGHIYEITDEEKADGVTIRTYTCTVCGDTYTQDLGNQYEKGSNYVEYLFNQYSPYMIWVFLSTAGVWSVFMGISVIIARKNEEKEKAKRMLVAYGIGMVVIFAILIACPYLVRGIAALVT